MSDLPHPVQPNAEASADAGWGDLLNAVGRIQQAPPGHDDDLVRAVLRALAAQPMSVREELIRRAKEER